MRQTYVSIRYMPGCGLSDESDMEVAAVTVADGVLKLHSYSRDPLWTGHRGIPLRQIRDYDVKTYV